MQYEFSLRSQKLILRALQERRGRLARKGEFVTKDEIKEEDDLDTLIEKVSSMVEANSLYKD